MDSKFTYGDAVIIKHSAPLAMHPGEYGSVCSLDQIYSQQEAERYACEIGEWVYAIEFGNGSDTQIAERYLDLDLGIIPGKELSKFSNYFINGTVFDIKMEYCCMEIKFESTKIHEVLPSKILINRYGCVSGNLIISGIQEANIRHSATANPWKEDGNIEIFQMSDHLLNLLIKWRRNGTTSLQVKASNFWWEQRQVEQAIRSS